MTYGLQVTSAPPHLISKMMRTVREGWSSTPPASSTWIASMLEPSVYRHPESMAVTGPLHTWAVMVAAGRVSREMLQDAWQVQTIKAPDPWKVIEGPAGAVAVQMQRRDYESLRWREWATREEQTPELPQARVPRAPGRYWLEPLRELFADAETRARWRMSQVAIACLRSTVIGGQWSQQRLFQHRYAESSECQACR
ncbi:unnamed protein product, partial [Prorocentrum cordatum]